MVNFIPQLTGPAYFRPATQYIHHTRLNQKAFLIPFEFNAEQAYVLEFTALKMRVLKDGGIIVESAKNITGISKATQGVVTSAGHSFSDGDEVFLDGIVGMTELNGQFVIVSDKDANTFKMKDVDGNYINTSDFTTYGSDGTAERVYEIATPYAEADLWELKYAQTADLMYIVHPSYAPGKLTRAGHANWTLNNAYTRTADPWTGANEYPGAVGFYGGRLLMGGSNNEPDVMRGSRGPDPTTGASRYDDWTVGTAASDGFSFTPNSINGSANRIRWFSGNSKFLVIGSFGGVFKANGGTDGAAITPTNSSVQPVSSYGTSDINPDFVGGQIVYAEVGERTVRSFEYDLLSDSYEAFDKNILAEEITYGGIKQLAFTQGRPDLIWACLENGDLRSCTFLSREDVAGWARQTIGGAGKVLSIASDARVNSFDRLVMCVERVINGHTRRYLEYLTDDPQTFDLENYFSDEDAEAEDLAIYKNLSFEIQKQFVRLDSSLVLDTTQTTTLTLAAVSGTEVVATAGSAVFSATDVNRLIFIKYLTGEETGVAEIIEYTSPTEVKVKITQTFHTTALGSGAWYFLTSSVGGLGHLEGATIGVVTDGGVHPDVTVSGGRITLDYPARYIIMGFRYYGFMRSMDLEMGARIGVAQGRNRNIVGVGFKFRNTLAGAFGTTLRGAYKAQQIANRRSGQDFYDRPPLLYSGTRMLTNFDNWETEKRVVIAQFDPLPMTVLGMVVDIEVED